jgi:hypothetical protein
MGVKLGRLSCGFLNTFVLGVGPSYVRGNLRIITSAVSGAGKEAKCYRDGIGRFASGGLDAVFSTGVCQKTPSLFSLSVARCNICRCLTLLMSTTNSVCFT